jgi:hypothetical protein
VAISSSRLPRSRSRTTAADVKITIVMLRISPISAGTICTAVRRSGLYSVRTSNVGAGLPYTPSRRGSGTEARPRATLSTIGSLPSTSSWAAGREASSTRRSKSGGKYTPTLISPALMRRRSSPMPALGAANSTTPLACRSARKRRDRLVPASSTTAARRLRTSKLIA